MDIAWDAFFANPNNVAGDALTDANDTTGNVRNGWKDSGLSPIRDAGATDSEADQAWANGWRDLRNDNGVTGDANTKGGRITNLIAANKKFSYTSYGQTTNDVDPLVQNKNDLDQAHRALANPYTPPPPGPNYDAAIEKVKNEMQQSPSVSDSELNAELGKDNWITWLRESQTQTELDNRVSQAISAIREVRRKRDDNRRPPNLEQFYREAIQAVKDHWKEKAGSDTGKINGKTLEEVLTSSWESGIRGKSNETDIKAERDRLKGLIDAEKAKEGSGPSGPSYPDNGDSGSGDGGSGGSGGDSSGDKTPPGEGKEPTTGPGGGTGGGSGSTSQGEQIVQEEGWQNISSETVDTIISELGSVNTQDGKDKDADLAKIKEILKKVNQAKSKKEFNKLARTLQEELKELQKNSQLVAQIQSLKKEVGEAIQHLENLEKKKPQGQDQQQSENWWKKQPTWVKAAIIFGILAGVILIGVIISQLTKKKNNQEMEE